MRPEWLTRCHVSDVDDDTLCGELSVPLQPGAPDGPRIDLRVVVVPAIRAVPEPDPLIMLAGGPGQAATEAFGKLLPTLKQIHERRDIVFMDQRGTGSSAPLACSLSSDDTLAQQLATADTALDDVVACRDELVAAGRDLTRYSTRHHTRDLEALRGALGVERWNLYGGSYGTRAALDYAEAYPDRVRSLVLDGVAPREMALFGTFATDAEAALRDLVASCEQDRRGCAQAFPDLSTRLQRVLTRDDTPVQLAHPRTGRRETLPLPGSVLGDGMRGVLYSPTLAAVLPAAIHQATQEPPELQPLVTLVRAASGPDLADTMTVALLLTVACAEDVPRIGEAHERAAADTFLGTRLIDRARTWCAHWPEGGGPAPVEPVSFDGPVLLLSGALDPVTPPRWAEAAAEHLSDHQHLVAPGGGHIVLPLGCIPGRVASFLDDGNTGDTSCVERIARPPFVVDFAGPPA